MHFISFLSEPSKQSQVNVLRVPQIPPVPNQGQTCPIPPLGKTPLTGPQHFGFPFLSNNGIDRGGFRPAQRLTAIAARVGLMPKLVVVVKSVVVDVETEIEMDTEISVVVNVETETVVVVLMLTETDVTGGGQLLIAKFDQLAEVKKTGRNGL